MAYTVRDALLVIRILSQMVQKNPKILNEEGVFRISGSGTKIIELIKEILEPTAFSSKLERLSQRKDFSIHEYIGAVKQVMRDIEPDPELYEELKKIAKNQIDLNHDTASLDDFFIVLIQSENLDNIYYAEILYDYFQLATASLQFEGETRMTPYNLGILLATMLNQNKSDFELMELFNTLAIKVIASKTYASSLSFNDYIYQLDPKLMTHLIKARNDAFKTVSHDIGYVGKTLQHLKESHAQSKKEEKELETELKSLSFTLGLSQYKLDTSNRSVEKSTNDPKRKAKLSEKESELLLKWQGLMERLELAKFKSRNFEDLFNQVLRQQKIDMENAASIMQSKILLEKQEKSHQIAPSSHKPTGKSEERLSNSSEFLTSQSNEIPTILAQHNTSEKSIPAKSKSENIGPLSPADYNPFPDIMALDDNLDDEYPHPDHQLILSDLEELYIVRSSQRSIFNSPNEEQAVSSTLQKQSSSGLKSSHQSLFQPTVDVKPSVEDHRNQDEKSPKSTHKGK
ncbi:RhoGAP domain-containing protein [Legionella sp. W05-934-2]|uniref:RhoGAP domain-containing protein n=1 Tax=Legionella sp. W05-934-2 TaxID=1198649 RepID=UPI0034620EBC